MVDEVEFMHMDLDENRSERFECDECDKESTMKWCGEISDECAEGLASEGWIYSEGNILCDECKHTSRNT